MDRYVYQILQEQGRVVIPEFGALIKRGSLIDFNNLLTFNDGMLTGLISAKENIGYDEAVKKIEDYAGGLKKDLQEKGSVSIEGVGKIEKDASGSFQLLAGISAENGKSPDRTDGKPDLDDEKGPVPETGKPEPGIDSVFSLDENESIEKGGPPGEDPPEAGVDRDVPADEPFFIDTLEEVIQSEEPAVRKGEAVADLAGGTTIPPPGEKRFAPAWLITIIIACILVICILLAWMFKPEFLSGILGKHPERTPESPPELMLLPDEWQAIDESIPAETTRARYYVVAGCFRIHDNARRYASFLNSRGYPARIFGKRGNLHAVCFDSFENKEEALEYMQKIRSEFEPEAWVLNY